MSIKQKHFPEMDSAVTDYGYLAPRTISEAIFTGLDLFINKCHVDSYNRGWYLDPITGLSLIPDDGPVAVHSTGLPASNPVAEQIRESWFPFVVATKIALIHSEASEMLEAFRTDAMDDKIPEFRGITAEAADVMIRVGDLMYMLRAHAEVDVDQPFEYNLGLAIQKKMSVNNTRADHALENRRKPNGKKF